MDGYVQELHLEKILFRKSDLSTHIRPYPASVRLYPDPIRPYPALIRPLSGSSSRTPPATIRPLCWSFASPTPPSFTHPNKKFEFVFEIRILYLNRSTVSGIPGRGLFFQQNTFPFNKNTSFRVLGSQSTDKKRKCARTVQGKGSRIQILYSVLVLCSSSVCIFT